MIFDPSVRKKIKSTFNIPGNDCNPILGSSFLSSYPLIHHCERRGSAATPSEAILIGVLQFVVINKISEPVGQGSVIDLADDREETERAIITRIRRILSWFRDKYHYRTFHDVWKNPKDKTGGKNVR